MSTAKGPRKADTYRGARRNSARGIGAKARRKLQEKRKAKS